MWMRQLAVLAAVFSVRWAPLPVESSGPVKPSESLRSRRGRAGYQENWNRWGYDAAEEGKGSNESKKESHVARVRREIPLAGFSGVSGPSVNTIVKMKIENN